MVDLLNELLETFRLEADDLLRALATLVVALERESVAEARAGIVEQLFRRMHTLKGAAHAVNLMEVAETCQSLEDLLAQLKRGDMEPELPFFDRFHGELNLLSETIFGPGGTVSQPPPEAAPAVAPQPASSRDEQMVCYGKGGEGADATPQPAPEKSPLQETARVPAHLLDALLLKTEELLSAKLLATNLAEDVAAGVREFSAHRDARARTLDLAHKVLRSQSGGELEGKLAAALKERCEREARLEQRLLALERKAERNVGALAGMVDPLLEDMKKLHLLPFASLLDSFPKLVRDLCRELGKEASFTCLGADLEVDRRILGELREPLLHLLRNVLDHGVEEGGERVQAGKKAAAAIVCSVRHLDGNRAELTVADDGRGIDLERLKAVAVRMELLSPEQAHSLSDEEALQLVFESGLSTSPIITNLSGRGLGLAIVRETLERLGGHVTLASRRGEGTTFRLVVPLSFAMVRGLLVECSGRPCLIPAAHVHHASRVPRSAIKTVGNRATVCLEGETLALVRLGDVLELAAAEEQPDPQPLVVLQGVERRIAFAVDQVAGMQEVLSKPLGPQLRRVRNIAGAALLGDGQAVPVLNTGDLFRSAMSARHLSVAAASAQRPAAKTVSVLVAEDSITSRTLLKNILQASGFRVRTAVNGSEALELLRSDTFDVVVSDVEMPRMDGFQLTAAIRRDQKLSELPVILVTGLESREDRERGIDVGANAYIVKSSFDQGCLVEAIGRLA